jgi:hypothetical protein
VLASRGDGVHVPSLADLAGLADVGDVGDASAWPACGEARRRCGPMWLRAVMPGTRGSLQIARD